ncbi:MAG: universal stress protein [Candidatus Rokubacteria bacterium]|nr:universal stress protein [Candidatus Rokubacteria bacterium]
MKRILVPLDGSLLSESVLPVAEEWAKEDGTEVILLRAVEAHHVRGPDDARAQIRSVDEGEAYLRGVADRLERRGIQQVRWAIWYSEPVWAITEAAGVNAVDLIAMATHGRGGLGRLVLGSVAAGVVRSVQAPVLLIRGQSAWKPWAAGKVLVPLDGSEASEAVLPVVERLAVPRGLSIVLVQVIDPRPSADLDDSSVRLGERMVELATLRHQEAERYLVKVAEPMKEKGLRVECEVHQGSPAETIAAFAAHARADLIAMTTHARGGLERLFFGSVAEGVLRHASVPVLLLKAGRIEP